MRLEIMGFSQDQLMQLGLSLDEVLLLRWFIDFKGTDRMEEHVNPNDGLTYYWVKSAKLVQDLPILTKSERYAARKFARLFDIGVLDFYSDLTAKGRKACYRVNREKYALLVLTKEDKAMTQNCDMGLMDMDKKAMTQNCAMAMTQNSDKAMTQNSDMPLYILDNKISIYSDNQLRDKGNKLSAPLISSDDPFVAFKDRFNKISDLKACARLTSQRRNFLAYLFGAFSKDEIETAFAKLEKSDFLTGRKLGVSGRQFKASFDWFIKLDNFTKVLEGAYDNDQDQYVPEYRPASNSDFDGVKGGLEIWQ